MPNSKIFYLVDFFDDSKKNKNDSVNHEHMDNFCE